MAKHEIWELQSMQEAPLSVKISMTESRIREWVDTYGRDGVYISFSGGKDSTVLLDIVRNRMGYKDIPAVFIDTGLEYPEIREFAYAVDCKENLRQSINFRQVIDKYGYPLISKEVSRAVYDARIYLTEVKKHRKSLTDRQTDRVKYAYYFADMVGVDRRKDKNNPRYQEIKMHHG